MIANAELTALAKSAGLHLAAAGKQMVTAESCTGGWISKVLTDIPGSSGWFSRGYLTYSNAAKQDMLAVSNDTLAASGAVSEQTVREMASGALARSGSDIAVAVSGIAGPGGGSADKPVGLVWFAWAQREGDNTTVSVRKEQFAGDRDTVRRQAVAVALRGVILMCDR